MILRIRTVPTGALNGETTMIRIAMKPVCDGFGFFYGEAYSESGDDSWRIDIMPPIDEWCGDTMLDGKGKPHKTQWVGYVDGNEIARALTRRDLEQKIAAHFSDSSCQNHSESDDEDTAYKPKWSRVSELYRKLLVHAVSIFKPSS